MIAKPRQRPAPKCHDRAHRRHAVGCLALGLSLSEPGGAETPDEPREAAAFAFEVAYTADEWANTRGGLATGTAYLDLLEASATVDGAAAFGLPGFVLHGRAQYDNAATFSDRYVGDATVVSNIDTDRGWRVHEAWLEWNSPHDLPASLRVGRYDLNSEFDTTEARRLFINSAYGIGQDLAQTGADGPSIFPSTTQAARLSWSPRGGLNLKVAALDCDLLIAEGTAVAGALSQVSIGYWQYASAFDDLLAVNPDGDPLRRSDNRGAYVTAQFDPMSPSPAAGPRWSTFLRAGIANGRINAFDRFLAAGVVVALPWLQDTRSRLGLAASSSRASDAYRRARMLTGERTDAAEYNVEITWQVPLGRHLVLQPDAQFLAHPGVNRHRQNAFAVGLRVQLALDW